MIKRNLFKFLLVLAILNPIFAGVARANDLQDLLGNDIDETVALKMLKEKPELLKERDSSGRNALHIAAEYARTNVVKWLLKHKANVNATDFNGDTPIFLTENGDIARMLIDDKADLKIRDNWGKTALEHAAQMQYGQVCEAILDSGFRLDLTSALLLGKREEAKKIIRKHPLEVQRPTADSDLWGNTSPLGIAAGNGDVEMTKILLWAGAPVNAETKCPNSGPITPLCNAVWGGHIATARLLCDAGANCNVTGGKLYPRLLDFAAEHSDPDMIDLLVSHGAKFGKDSLKGQTPPAQ
jgi:ankyrin repeat protein